MGPGNSPRTTAVITILFSATIFLLIYLDKFTPPGVRYRNHLTQCVFLHLSLTSGVESPSFRAPVVLSECTFCPIIYYFFLLYKHTHFWSSLMALTFFLALHNCLICSPQFIWEAMRTAFHDITVHGFVDSSKSACQKYQQHEWSFF